MAFFKGEKGEAWVTCDTGLQDENGRPIKFDAKFKIEKTSVAREHAKPWHAGELSDIEFFQQVVLDWRNVFGEDRAKIEFSAEALADMFDVVHYKNAVVSGYMKRQYDVEIKNP